MTTPIKPLVEMTCIRSGLKFYSENRRTKVHPEISWYTTHKDNSLRYKAVAVIDRGKIEGWDNLEKFKTEIEIALAPPPPVDYDYEGNYVAKIEGWHPQYNLVRNFLTPVDTNGRFKRYSFKDLANGFYETVYKSAKGNKTKSYFEVTDSGRTSLTEDQLLARFAEAFGDKPQHNPMSDTFDHVVEECWECGATYHTYGNVESGNMGCRRCA